MDNSNLGLNKFLQPIGSPIEKNQGAGDSFMFDYLNERNSVSNAKITSLTANKIQTGLLTAVATLGIVGGAAVIIDGINNRIIVNDGTTNRVVIGSV